MARRKEFDREEVLFRAMNVFWERGFEATTMSALVRALGIGRQSLYDTFGDREQLYRECLDAYERFRAEDIARLRATEGPLVPALAGHFENAIAESQGACAKNGCLMLNAAVERGRDSAIREHVAKHFRALEDLLTEKLRAAKASGEIGSDQPPRTLARFLLSALNGLRVTARFTDDRRHLRGIVRATLAALD